MASADDRVVLHLARNCNDRWRALDVGQALARIKSGALARRSEPGLGRSAPGLNEFLTGRALLRLAGAFPLVRWFSQAFPPAQHEARPSLASQTSPASVLRVCFPRRRQNRNPNCASPRAQWSRPGDRQPQRPVGSSFRSYEASELPHTALPVAVTFATKIWQVRQFATERTRLLLTCVNRSWVAKTKSARGMACQTSTTSLMHAPPRRGAAPQRASHNLPASAPKTRA